MKAKTVRKSSSVNMDDFRKDIENNVEFSVLKSKYGVKTQKELDSYLYKLSKQDSKIYEYKYEKVRVDKVYESKDGFIKISKREVDKIKTELNLSKLEFENKIILEGNKIILELKIE